MVAYDVKERRNYARYALEGVKALASQRHVAYRFPNVQQQVANLGLGLEDVCHLLEHLTPDQFKESVLYADSPQWHDVYLVPAGPVAGLDGELYVKFHLSPSRTWLNLCSCHL